MDLRRADEIVKEVESRLKRELLLEEVMVHVDQPGI